MLVLENLKPTISTGLTHRLPALKALGACAVGGVIWAVAFGVRLSEVPAGWWQWRDDAVITLSHSRNLIDFGSIGVSPGGDRVEGFSSPLHFALSSVAFALTDSGYEALLNLQVLACILLSGSLTTLIAYRSARLVGLRGTALLLASMLFTSFAAVLVVSSWTTVGWLVSGMENPLYLVIGLALIALSLGTVASNWRFAAMGVLIAMLGLSRVEFVALMPAVVGACALVVAASTPSKSLQQRIAFSFVVGIPVAAWSIVHVARWAYFGSLLPNTALVQNRATGPRQFITIAVLTAFFGVWAWLVLSPTRSRTRYVAASLALAFIALLAVTKNLKYVLPGSGTSFPKMLLAILVFVGIGVVLMRKSIERLQAWDIVIASLVFVPVAQFLVMGPARMEAFRVFSLAAPFAVVWLATIFLRLWVSSERALSTTATRRRNRVGPIAAVALSLALAGAGILFDAVRVLPWEITSTQSIVTVAQSLNLNQGDGNALPIVANPDLGKISFEKNVIMADLGLLGDPLLARISKRRPDLEGLFLNGVAKPDVVQTHGYWSCKFKKWINSEDFKDNYELAEINSSEAESQYANCPESGGFAIWSRIGSESEYSLTRKIARSPEPITIIRAAVSECVAAIGDVLRCQSVRRAVTRNSPMLKERGELVDAADAFKPSPTSDLDRALLLRGRNWADSAFRSFTELADQGRISNAQSR